MLGYKPVLEKLAAEGKVDGDGFVEDRVWLEATCDHEWPDVPRRAWDAFHRQVVNPADVMFTLNDGYCAGFGNLDKWIDMQSTHGGLNQINSDAVLMTMTGPVRVCCAAATCFPPSNLAILHTFRRMPRGAELEP